MSVRSVLVILLGMSVLSASIPQVVGHSHDVGHHALGHLLDPHHTDDGFRKSPASGESDERWHMHDATLLGQVLAAAGTGSTFLAVSDRGDRPPNPLITSPQPGFIDQPLRPPSRSRAV